MNFSQSRRPINFRSFGLVAVVMIITVACAYTYLHNRILGIILFFVMFAALATVAVVKTVGFVKRKSHLGLTVTLWISVILCALSFAFATTTAEEWNKYELSGERAVHGRVCGFNTSDGNINIDLCDLTLDGVSVPGKLRLLLRPSENSIAEIVKVGDVLSFNANVKCKELLADHTVNGTAYRTDIRYSASAYSRNISIEFGEANWFEIFMDKMYRLFVDNMGDKYGNIAFTMITGDKNALDIGVVDYFSAAGIAHVLAVSGLHVGFVAGLINLILFKADRRVKFAVTAVVLLCYTVIAGFSPSVIRAVIMVMISMSAFFVSGRRDMMSSLGCAFSLILAFRPFYLFEPGFLMSFGANLGIALFAGSIARIMSRRGNDNKAAEAIATSVSVEIGVLPTLVAVFGRLQILAVIVNIVLIPYMSVLFSIMLCLAPIAALPGCGVVLSVCRYMLTVPDYIAMGIAAVPWANIDIRSTYVAYLFYPVMIIASEYFIMPRGKIVVVLLSVAVCAAILGLSAAVTETPLEKTSADGMGCARVLARSVNCLSHIKLNM